jgi:hypothetical protein
MGFIHLQIEWDPLLGGYHPQIPILYALYPQLNLLNPPEKIPGYDTGETWTADSSYLRTIVLSIFSACMCFLMYPFVPFCYGVQINLQAWITEIK